MGETALGQRVRQHTTTAFRFDDYLDWKIADSFTGGIPDWCFVAFGKAFFFEFKLLRRGSGRAHTCSPQMQQVTCKRLAKANAGRCWYYLFDRRNGTGRTILCAPHALSGLDDRLEDLPALASQDRLLPALKALHVLWVPGWDYTLATKVIQESAARAIASHSRPRKATRIRSVQTYGPAGLGQAAAGASPPPAPATACATTLAQTLPASSLLSPSAGTPGPDGPRST